MILTCVTDDFQNSQKNVTFSSFLKKRKKSTDYRGSAHAPVNGGPVFSGDIFRTFLDLITTFWLSFYYFLHCIILFLHCRLSFSKLILDFGIFNVYQIRANF